MTRQKLEDSVRNTTAFSVVRRLSNQVLASSGSTVITYDTSLFNDEGSMDVSSGVYTCPKAGRMLVSVAAPIQNNSGAFAQSFVEILVVDSGLLSNGLIVDSAQMNNGSTIFCKGFAFVPVQLGTTISARVYNFTSGIQLNKTGFGSDSISFSGFYST